MRQGTLCDLEQAAGFLGKFMFLSSHLEVKLLALTWGQFASAPLGADRWAACCPEVKWKEKWRIFRFFLRKKWRFFTISEIG